MPTGESRPNSVLYLVPDSGGPDSGGMARQELRAGERATRASVVLGVSRFTDVQRVARRSSAIARGDESIKTIRKKFKFIFDSNKIYFAYDLFLVLGGQSGAGGI